MKKLKVAIVGTGSIAKMCHIKHWLNRDDSEVVACADIDLPKAQAFAKEFGIPKAYSNIYDMLENEEIDIVDVCTWVAAHAECTIAAAKAKCHVMCEKPMCDTMEAAEKMKAAVEENGVKFMLAVPLRYDKRATYVRGLVDKGDFGEVYYGRTAYLRSRGIPNGWFSCKKYSGGGPLIDIGVHRIDLAWYLMGCPKPYSVSAVTPCLTGDYRANHMEGGWEGCDVPDYEFNIEDSAHGFIRFENGASLYFDASWTFNADDGSFTQVVGVKRGCEYDNFKFVVNNGPLAAFEEHTGDFKGNSFENEIAHMVDCVKNDKTPGSDIEQAYALQSILCAVYESAKTGHEVVLNLK